MRRRNQKGQKPRKQSLRLWTQPEARQALPYLRSVVSSIREHYLEASQQHRHARRLDEQPGRPSRGALVARQEARAAADRAEAAYEAAVGELQDLDVYSLSPGRGEALIPFVHEDQLCWLVFDLFDNRPLSLWRYHTDPMETRRPLADLESTSEMTIVT